MVRPADRAKAVAKMAELRAVQPRFPLYGSVDAAGRAAVFARAARRSRRARAAGTADRARRRGRRPDRRSARRRSRSAASSRDEPGRGVGRVQPRPARAHRLRRSARRPVCSGSAAARGASMLVRVPERRDRRRWSTRCAQDFKDEFINARSYRVERRSDRPRLRSRGELPQPGRPDHRDSRRHRGVERHARLHPAEDPQHRRAEMPRRTQRPDHRGLHAAGHGARPGRQPARRGDGARLRSRRFRWRSARRRRRCSPRRTTASRWSAALQGIGDRRAGLAAVLGRAAAAGAVRQAVAAAARRDGAAAPRDWTRDRGDRSSCRLRSSR